jgi:hypothetical protein
MHYVALFLAGAFLCNSVPHLTAALRGETFPSPFAKPPGEGPSSPLVNFLWGGFNFVIGALFLGANPVMVGLNLDTLALFAGALALGAQLSIHFGKVRGN